MTLDFLKVISLFQTLFQYVNTDIFLGRIDGKAFFKSIFDSIVYSLISLDLKIIMGITVSKHYPMSLWKFIISLTIHYSVSTQHIFLLRMGFYWEKLYVMYFVFSNWRTNIIWCFHSSIDNTSVEYNVEQSPIPSAR